MAEPIQSAMPEPGLSPLDLAHDVLDRIEQGASTGSGRIHRGSGGLTRIVGHLDGGPWLQDLSVWASAGFVLAALVTVVNALEPFFA